MAALCLWYTIVLKVGVVHCCIFMVYMIFFVLEGPFRLAMNAIFVPRMRRKGLYLGKW